MSAPRIKNGIRLTIWTAFKDLDWPLRQQRLMQSAEAPHSTPVTPYGDSVGHYAGDAPVVDTAGSNHRTYIDHYRTPRTEQIHVAERFKMVGDADFRTPDPHHPSRFDFGGRIICNTPVGPDIFGRPVRGIHGFAIFTKSYAAWFGRGSGAGAVLLGEERWVMGDYKSG